MDILTKSVPVSADRPDGISSAQTLFLDLLIIFITLYI